MEITEGIIEGTEFIKSELSSLELNIVYKEYDTYYILESMFEDYGIAILDTERDTVVIDGEQLLKLINEGYYEKDDYINAIDAHEFAHKLIREYEYDIVDDEKFADVIAYYILKDHCLFKAIELIESRFVEQYPMHINDVQLTDEIKEIIKLKTWRNN